MTRPGLATPLVPVSVTTAPRDAPLALVISGDSLRGRRSGVGRMTLEIIEAVRHREELASLNLLMGGQISGTAAVLEQLDQPDAPLSRPPPGALLRAKRMVAWVPGVQRLRALKRQVLQRQLLATLQAGGGGQVVYHEPNMIPHAWRGPTVVTVNDLSWHHHPEFHPADRLAWIGRNLRRTLRTASRFVAISVFTKAAMVQELGVDPARVDVVPLAAGAQFVPVDAPAAAPALGRHELTDRSYVLAVSTLEPRKNFDRLVAAHLSLPQALRRRHPLVIVGGSGWGTTLATKGAERARQDGTLRLLGHVDDADLVALYARAAAFAYVSLYEGFGLPVLEAMATGVPVLASSTTATGETAGDAAILVDPLDTAAIAEGLRRVLEDPALAERLQASSLARAAQFSWDRTATTLIETWRHARG